MEGIIIKYYDEKGYGFIVDENYQDRFFHISEVKEQNKFKEYLDRLKNSNINIVTFTPEKTKKGHIAIKIFLSSKKCNDTYCKDISEALVTDVEKCNIETSYIVQGIKRGQSIPYCATAGSNGTYRVGYPEVHRYLTLSFIKIGGIGWGDIEIRDLALNINERQNVTDKFVAELKNKLNKEKIKIFGNNGQWEIKNTDILKL